VVTKYDPDIGTSDLATLGALARYRREGVTEPLPFGVYGDVIVPGRVRIGDPVTTYHRGAGLPPGHCRAPL
jgi:MOSC domain-containing protein YiiM